jgi:hypothetical protein
MEDEDVFPPPEYQHVSSQNQNVSIKPYDSDEANQEMLGQRAEGEEGDGDEEDLEDNGSTSDAESDLSDTSSVFIDASNTSHRSGKASSAASVVSLASIDYRNVVPEVGDLCVVFREKNSDFFRPMVTDEMLGGWFPAKVTKVEVDHMLTNHYRKLCQRSRKKKGAAESSGPPPEPQTYYKVTVASEFFLGTKNYTFPCESQSILLAELSSEDVSGEDDDGGYSHQSYSIRYDPHNVIFQARPDDLEVGDLVFARYQAGERWYRGRIASVYRQHQPQTDDQTAMSGEEETFGDENDDEMNSASMLSPSEHRHAPPSTREAHLCCVAYDGDQHGMAAYETDIPYRECVDGRPIVYLAYRGRHDLRWLKLELERIRDSDERLHALDPSKEIREPNQRDIQNGAVITVVVEKRHEARSSLNSDDRADASDGSATADADKQLVIQHYRYEDVVSAVFKASFQRDKSKISVLEWPENPNIQKNRSTTQGGGTRKKHKRKSV